MWKSAKAMDRGKKIKGSEIMFCVGCGYELGEDANFCFSCGQDLSKYQKNVPEEVNKEFKENSKIKEDETAGMDEDSVNLDTKLNNLTDIISKLQDENNQLKKELEKYKNRPKSSVSKSKSEIIRKKMPKPDREEKSDIVARFKKWYNE